MPFGGSVLPGDAAGEPFADPQHPLEMTNGCPPANNSWGAPAGSGDRDHDNIADMHDACPDQAGPENSDPKLNGCPLGPWGAPVGAPDRDGDHVADMQDACPDTPGVKTNDP